MKFKLSFWLTVLFIVVIHNIEACPPECTCSVKYTKVSCKGKNITTDKLIKIVQEIPLNTTEINLIENNITSIPQAFFRNFSNLDSLNLAKNMISEFPRFLPRSLKSLKLGSNKIQEISEMDFVDIINLEQLDLYGNRITDIPANVFATLKQLNMLYMESNLVSSVSKHAFVGLSQLIDLYLTNNKIIMLEAGTLDVLSNLKTLNLANNLLKKIPANLFSKVESLKMIRLNENSITYIQPKSFQNLHLISMDLSNNHLNFVNAPMFYNLTIKNRLELDENPILCDCHLYEAMKLYSSASSITGQCNGTNEELTDVILKNSLNCTICTNVPCNNGTCNIVDQNTFNCSCDKGFFGKMCEYKDFCYFKPCINNGSCENIGRQDYKCNCQDQYSGKRCDIERKDSKLKPGYIVLIVLMVLLVLVVVIGVAYFIRRRSQSRNEKILLSEKSPLSDTTNTV